MSISSLTREMITEYESMIGRQITPTEYLQFREQAMREIQNGFNITPEPEQKQPMEKEINPYIPVENITKSEQKPKTEIKKPVKHDKKESVTEVDPFFLLVDKMDA